MINQHLILIGSSVGGPMILNTIFTDMPRLSGSIIVIQHMPDYINDHVAESLDKLTQMDVSVATNDQWLQDGHVYIAPTGKHLTLTGNHKIKLRAGEKINHVCPSIDVAMKSVQVAPDVRVMGIILSGIGFDGIEGIKHIKEIEGVTVAQDEASSTVFGMPKAVIATGNIDFVLNTEQIRDKIISFMAL